MIIYCARAINIVYNAWDKSDVNKKMGLLVEIQKKSIKIDVQANKTYMWCSCGLSDNQPFCDGSHKGTSFVPVKYVADEDKKVGFCSCKKTKTSPFCDGSHRED
jgi:CDGSH-type Zn-finger protein